MSSSVSCPTILLVEDSEDDAYFFRWTLRKCGMPCDVTLAVDGGVAIEHLERAKATGRHPDLVFLDLKIPTFSGFQVLAWIREQQFDPPLDVSVLSGSEHAIDVQRATALGANGYFVKPLSLEQLRARLQEWQERQSSRPSQKAADVQAAGAPNGSA